eukprot:scaffold32973_cov31-Tisochrysis_lutea.AAC.1
MQVIHGEPIPLDLNGLLGRQAVRGPQEREWRCRARETARSHRPPSVLVYGRAGGMRWRIGGHGRAVLSHPTPRRT